MWVLLVLVPNETDRQKQLKAATTDNKEQQQQQQQQQQQNKPLDLLLPYPDRQGSPPFIDVAGQKVLHAQGKKAPTTPSPHRQPPVR